MTEQSSLSSDSIVISQNRQKVKIKFFFRSQWLSLHFILSGALISVILAAQSFKPSLLYRLSL